MSAPAIRIAGFEQRWLFDRGSGEWSEVSMRGGIAIVPARALDEFGTRAAIERHEAEKSRAWHSSEMALHRSLQKRDVEPVIRSGWALHHFGSGRRLTPAGWLFDRIEDAADAAEALLADEWGAYFEGHLADIQHFGLWVIGVHRSHGCFTGRHHHLAVLDAAIDQGAYETRLAALRSGQACERWRIADPVQGRAA